VIDGLRERQQQLIDLKQVEIEKLKQRSEKQEQLKQLQEQDIQQKQLMRMQSNQQFGTVLKQKWSRDS